MHSLWKVFLATVSRVPSRPAIVMGDTQYSFQCWRDRAEGYRAAYLSADVNPGDRVLLWVSNNFDIAAALVATWGVGAIPVLMDAGCRGPQLRHALQSVRPRVVVTEKPLPELSTGLPCETLHTTQVPDKYGEPNIPDPRTLPTDPASIVFTSGSTGNPKGVVQSHANLLRGCHAVLSYLQIQDTDKLLCPVPWSFDYGYGQLLTTIVFGVTHILPTLQNPFGICEAIKQHSPSVLAGTPALYNYLVGGMSPIGTTDISSLRLLTNTGGALHNKVLEKLLKIFTGAQLILNYGLTETYRSCYLPADMIQERAGSIGIPIPGVDIVVVREDGTLAAPGEHGELVHRGDYIFLGYWGDPEATAKAIGADPLLSEESVAGSRSLYTGDIGYCDDDGFLYFVSRRDHQLKSMGVRVSPGEVEAILHDSDMVQHTAVFGLPDEVLGHEVWAAVAPSIGAEFVLRDLQRHARANMSQYMLPRQYLVLDELPRTKTGKVDYKRLVELAGDACSEAE